MNDRMPASRPLFVLSAILLMTVHAFLMNGHQHVYPYLTVGNYATPIFAKADPTLFKNSLYVQAVKHSNVRLTLFYDVSPFIIKYFDLETFSIVQEIVSLGFILAGIYTLTYTLCGSSIAGYMAMLLYTAETNQWILGSPSSYANFFHHGIPYSYPLIVWSLVFFLKQRYVPAFLLAGISWNFHPMCTVFLLGAYLLYGIFSWKEFKPATIGACTGAFIIPALPILIKSVGYLSAKTIAEANWFTVVLWTAWYTCFPSTWPFILLFRASLFFLLFLMSLWILPAGRIKRALKIFILSVALLCLAGTVFADWYPIPLMLQLSLWRSTLIYLFIAIPCIGYLLSRVYQLGFGGKFLALATIILLSGYLKGLNVYYFLLFIFFFMYVLCEQHFKNRISFIRNTFSLVLLLSITILFIIAGYAALDSPGYLVVLLFFSSTMVFLLIARLLEAVPRFSPVVKRPLVVLLLFMVCFDGAVLYYRGGPEIYYHGQVRGKVDPWADIQQAAQKVSNTDDLFIVPPYMNDFGIYSLRASLGDWAEGSHALYLGNQFASEWLSRMRDLGWKKFSGEKEGYNSLTTEEVLKAANKYGAKFVITEKPKQFDLPRIYENSKFSLYQVQ
jgi:hypothetical protein